MASLFKRGNTWYAKWYQAGTIRRMSLKTTSKARAREKIVEIERNLEAGLPVDQRPDSPIDEATRQLTAYLTTARRPHTVKSVIFEWKRFMDWAKPVQLGDVTPETVHRYKLYLLGKGYEKSTVRSSLCALSGAFSVCIKELRILKGENPCKGIELPEAEKRLPVYLSIEQINAALTAAEAHSADQHMVFALGILAGLRKGEIVAARWEWADPVHGILTVQSGHGFTPKSGRDRAIPISERLRGILERYRPADGAGYMVHSDKEPKESPTAYRCDFTEAFASVVEAAHLPKTITPHKLRHTFGAQLAQGGVSLYKIGQWLGHADPKTTLIYAHLQPVDRDIEKFGAGTTRHSAG